MDLLVGVGAHHVPHAESPYHRRPSLDLDHRHHLHRPLRADLHLHGSASGDPRASAVQLVPQDDRCVLDGGVCVLHVSGFAREHSEDDCGAEAAVWHEVRESREEDGSREQHRVHRVLGDLLPGGALRVSGVRSGHGGQSAHQLRHQQHLVPQHREARLLLRRPLLLPHPLLLTARQHRQNLLQTAATRLAAMRGGVHLVRPLLRGGHAHPAAPSHLLAHWIPLRSRAGLRVARLLLHLRQQEGEGKGQVLAVQDLLDLSWSRCLCMDPFLCRYCDGRLHDWTRGAEACRTL